VHTCRPGCAAGEVKELITFGIDAPVPARSCSNESIYGLPATNTSSGIVDLLCTRLKVKIVVSSTSSIVKVVGLLVRRSRYSWLYARNCGVSTNLAIQAPLF